MITPGLCFSYKREIIEGVHSREDEYYLALYTRDAALSGRTTQYTTAGETIGPGYTPGGKPVSNFVSSLNGAVACLDFTAPEWSDATFVARGGLVYNRSKQNRAVAVVNFGADMSATTGTFAVDFPVAGERTSLIRIA